MEEVEWQGQEAHVVDWTEGCDIKCSWLKMEDLEKDDDNLIVWDRLLPVLGKDNLTDRSSMPLWIKPRVGREGVADISSEEA